ncbi:AAA family ATPase [Corynebacterium suedekumii]|uniref:AAA family ATPase n=1 Tax=Corynebacterium suedekumii TaxID=3049801 RepID=A0ABY8VNI2_9CORY|nr:AAA family ATPase [Corynebacterium suedekumii]WIM70223.1 AAA family ATPase [Corynebacterium suedekumii]
MATKDQMKALVKSHAQGDDPQFYGVAMQVAARAARAGQSKFAQELRDLVDELRREAPHRPDGGSVIPLTRPKSELAQLLDVSYPNARWCDLTYDSQLKLQLRQVLSEQKKRNLLETYGLKPAHRLLFVGPPGTGKTTTAHVIAAELGLTVFSIKLDTVLTKYLGESATKLRMIFDSIPQMKGVYLFDEVDAIAGNRGASNDVGEVRRILNSFLQFLEEDTSDSIIIAATNHPELLDAALFRRFDTILEFDPPGPKSIPLIIKNRLASLEIAINDWGTIVRSASGLSHAEITTIAENAAKFVILSGRGSVQTKDILRSLNNRRKTIGRR